MFRFWAVTVVQEFCCYLVTSCLYWRLWELIKGTLFAPTFYPSLLEDSRQIHSQSLIEHSPSAWADPVRRTLTVMMRFMLQSKIFTTIKSDSSCKVIPPRTCCHGNHMPPECSTVALDHIPHQGVLKLLVWCSTRFLCGRGSAMYFLCIVKSILHEKLSSVRDCRWITYLPLHALTEQLCMWPYNLTEISVNADLFAALKGSASGKSDWTLMNPSKHHH